MVNRFIVQSLLGSPLTIYGKGKHQRGFISLNDSIQALELAITNPANPGDVQVWNQLSEWHSMNAIAKMVISELAERGIKVTKTHINSPRTEHTGTHYYKYVTTKLKKLGYKPTRSIREEVKYTSDLLLKYKARLEGLRSKIMPTIKWQ